MPTEIISTFEVDDIWGKIYRVPQGYFVPQHSHEHDHITLLIEGSMEVWIEEKYEGRFVAPASLGILKGRRHTFKTLAPTTFCCLHNLRGTGLEAPAIAQEHEIGDIALEAL